MKNLLEELQNDILKTDITDTMEHTKEKIIDQISEVIFEEYQQEIEILDNKADELVKKDNATYSKIINTLFK